LKAERNLLWLEIVENLTKDPKMVRVYKQPINRSAATGLPVGVPPALTIRYPANVHRQVERVYDPASGRWLDVPSSPEL
jgi:hypothetical protein